MSETLIRKARPEDADPLSKCFKAAYAYWMGLLPDLPDVTGGMAEEIATRRVYVAEGPSGILGGAILDLSQTPAYVINVGVHPDVTGIGLGRRLMETVEHAARTDGADSIALSTHLEMTRAVEFYTRLGYAVTQREGTRISMAKSLVTG